ncbi:protein Niban 1a [Scomber scombrus]|uniref:Protein Niban 1a n=1 Tax=Scomber scombrus TaxID=13677 RepID=A0AAV1Q1A3_SCOSC
MGSATSLLDEPTSNYIKGQAEAELKGFSPYYRKQFSVWRFSQVEDDLEQQKEMITQLLKQKEALQEGEVLYEEGVLYFDDTRKWRERYVVVRANYCLECHDSLETFVKGVPPRHKLLPTGGTVLTTEEKYMAMVDKCFPDDTNVKEDFAPPLSGMPGQFPVYLRLPYRRDSYFCFRQQVKQAAFLSILSDCIRHQNQDFLKKKTCEVQAFLKAIQLYRQDKGRYEAWDMLIGSDVRVMGNLVMEQLLPSLEKDMLPRLKAKKTEKKRVWFATVEAAYILVQEHLLEGLSALKEDCRLSVRQQEVLIHSDMDQILNSRQQLEEKVRAKVSEPAEKLCSERVQPYLGSVLEELMEPISSGFHDGRQLSESMMDQVCQEYLQGAKNDELKKALADMARPNLLSCFQKIGSLQQKLQHLQERFGFSDITGVIHSAQIDLQQLMENAACTFEQLLYKAVQDNPDGAGSAIEKAKHRVLKQYDYDSSTVRKRSFQDALVSITLPFIKKHLAPTCKTELQALEPSVYADHSNFIHVENVYEGVLLQTLDKEVTQVVKEAASLKKYNLFTDSRDLVSESSRSSLSSPSRSTPGSPAMLLASPAKTSTEATPPSPCPPSPLVVNGLSSSPKKKQKEQKEQKEEKKDTVLEQSEPSAGVMVIETPLGEIEQKEAAASVAISQEATLPAAKAEEVIQSVQAETSSTVAPEAPVTPVVPKKSEAPEAPVTPVVPKKSEASVASVVPETPEAPVVPIVSETCEASVASVVPIVPESPKAPEAPAAAPAETTTAPAETATVSETQDVSGAAAAQTKIQEEKEISTVTTEAETSPELQIQNMDAEITSSEITTVVESIKADLEEAAAHSESPAEDAEPEPEPVIPATECNGSQTAASSSDEAQPESAEDKSAAPSGGETAVITPSSDLKAEEDVRAELNSLDVSAGSEPPPSDVSSSMEETKALQSGKDVVMTTTDVVEEEEVKHARSDEPAEEKTTNEQPSPQTEAVSVESVEAAEAHDGSAKKEVPSSPEAKQEVPSSPEAKQEAPSSPEATEDEPSNPEDPPLDCIKEIRNLVVEVIEVEELLQRYPSGVPTEE